MDEKRMNLNSRSLVSIHFVILGKILYVSESGDFSDLSEWSELKIQESLKMNASV